LRTKNTLKEKKAFLSRDKEEEDPEEEQACP
jgi:hypothetical protein